MYVDIFTPQLGKSANKNTREKYGCKRKTRIPGFTVKMLLLLPVSMAIHFNFPYAA